MAKTLHHNKLPHQFRLPSARRMVLGVFLLAFLMRGIYLLDSGDNPTFLTPIVDAQTYDGLARTLAGGRPITRDFFWQPLFYPMFLALLYKLSNFSLLWVKIIQAVLGSVTAVLTYRLGAKIFGSRTGLLAGVMTAVYMPLVFFETELLATGWAAFWMVTMVLALLRVKEEPRPWPCFIFGLIGAFAIITRPVFLFFFGEACAWLVIIWIRGHLGATQLMQGIVSLAFGFLLVAGPVWMLSQRVTGRGRIMPYSGGINFYIGNNPDYNKTITIRPGLGWRQLTATPARQGIEDDRGMEKFFRSKTIDYILSEPVSFFKGLVYKTAQFFNSREMPRNTDIYLFRKWSRLLDLFLWKVGGFGFPFGALLPLALLGLVYSWRQLPGPMWLCLLFYPAAVILVFVTSRYRMPLVPVMIVLAAAGLVGIWDIKQKQQWKRLVVAGAIVLAGGVISSATGPFYEERLNYEAELYFGLGSTLDGWGRVEQAKTVYSKAIYLREDYAEAHYNLANILKSQGRLEEAINHYRQSVQGEPNSVEIRNNFGAALQMQGKVDQAVEQWEKVLELDPANPYAHLNLGLMMAAQGKQNLSIRHLKEALQERPEWVEVHINLGLMLFQQGEVREAILHFTEALRLKPDDVGVHCHLGIALGTQGGLDEAMGHFRQAIALRPDTLVAHYNLGYALQLQGNFSEATAEYRRVLEIDPNHTEARRQLESLLRK